MGMGESLGILRVGVQVDSGAQEEKGGSFLDEYEDLDDFESIENTYLTFSVGKEVYAVGIEHVTEIVGLQEMTRLPDVPDYVRGVMNLRGKIVPNLDLRRRFRMQCQAPDERSVTIVLDVDGQLAGWIVDQVHDVKEFPPEAVEAPPRGSPDSGGEALLKGIGRSTEGVCLLLNAEMLMREGNANLPELPLASSLS